MNTPLLGKSEIAALIPHAGSMCLLESVLAWNQNSIRCSALSHRNPDNPLLHDGKLQGVCGIEYAAQAMAVHGRLSGMLTQTPKTGYLASIRELICRVDRLDQMAGSLVIEAEQMLGDAERVIYQFRLWSGKTELLSGRAAVVLQMAAAL